METAPGTESSAAQPSKVFQNPEISERNLVGS